MRHITAAFAGLFALLGCLPLFALQEEREEPSVPFLKGDEVAWAPIEGYLEQALLAEMGEGAHLEALKAQAVAARSTLWTELRLGTEQDNEPIRQKARRAGRLMAIKSPASGKMPHVIQDAVAATRGEVLFFQGEATFAPFSAHCGGHTRPFSSMWPPPGKTVATAKFGSDPRDVWSRPDADEDFKLDLPDTNRKSSNYADWYPWYSKQNSRASNKRTKQLEKIWCHSDQKGMPNYLKEKWRWNDTITVFVSSYADGNRTIGEVTINRTRSGHILSIKTSDTEISGEAKVRELGNYHRGLPSSSFVPFGGFMEGTGILRSSKGPYRFECHIFGAGYGHGVGMCQAGAMTQAVAGRTYEEIIEHYYSGSEVRRLWE